MRPKRYALAELPVPLLRIASEAWRHGGSLLLGPWAATHLTPWCARTYGEPVARVREERHDTTDYQLANEGFSDYVVDRRP